MNDVPGGQQGYPGQQTHADDKTKASMHRFMTEQILARVNTAMLVLVKKVTNKGEVKEVGMVDVQPLAKMMDGEGNSFSHGVINDIPYFRLQGGKSAVIIDPKAGDIGVAVFADRDISGVKRAKKEAPPGSFRRFDFADGLFFPCFLGGTPENFVRFKDDGTIIVHHKSDFEGVFASDVAQIKQKGGLHISVTKDDIILGKAPIIGPDPHPDD